jgi:hypothetical protein
MTTGRTPVIAALVMAAGLALTGCQGAARGDAPAAEDPAVVEPAADGGPALITLTPDGAEKLQLQTTPVEAGTGGRLGIPYAAIVYAADGTAWTFVQVAEHTFQRAPLTVGSITGNDAVLIAGPAAGTEVVTVGAAELVGAEAQIDGGE